MHDTAYNIGSLAMNIYADLATASVLEIGSQSVNGALRENALPTTHYVGVDIGPGEGVDLVVQPGSPLPVPEGSFDLVIASSVLEHDSCFWLTFLEMCKATKDGGYVYINAPSNGKVHRYPQDHWRFYPDSGRALASWANSQGEHVTLVESFIADREQDMWNDFVAVFRKGRITSKLPAVFIHDHVPSVNVHTWKSKEVLRPREETEDMVLLRELGRQQQQLVEQNQNEVFQNEQLRHRIQQLEGEIAQSVMNSADLEQMRHDLTGRDEQLARMSAELNALSAELTGARLSSDEHMNELTELRGKMTHRESELRQREEEIAQTRKELADASALSNHYSAQLEGAREQLSAQIADKNKQLEIVRLEAEESIQAARRRVDALQQEYDEVRRKLVRQEESWDHNSRKQNWELTSLRSQLDERWRELGELAKELRETRQGATGLQKNLENVEAEMAATAIELERAIDSRTSLQAEIESLRAGKLEAEAAKRDLQAKNVENELKAAARNRELAEITRILGEQEETSKNAQDLAEWIGAINLRLRIQPLWWSFLPRRWRLQRQLSRLEAYGLFDARAYLRRYPDVANQGIDPLEHYMRHGIKESRVI